MDMGSSSLPASLACGSNDSLNGLKFGKKIYFEDGGGGGSSSKASSGQTPAKKGKMGVQGVQQPPRCQVEGCNVDLSDSKAYYSKHKVCGMHSKSPKVIVAGLEQRFCQQCSRFHQLPEFDQGKRSCRRRLAGHNERRRKPPPGSISRIGRLSSTGHEDSSRFRSFMMDFTYAKQPGNGRDTWPINRSGNRVVGSQWQGGLNALASGVTAHGFGPSLQGSPSSPMFSVPENSNSFRESLAGISDSSCALSLLSTHQPRSSTTAQNRVSMVIPANTSFDMPHVVQQPGMPSSYMANSWEFKGPPEASGTTEAMQHPLEFSHISQPDNQRFSGELELAFQGNKLGMNLDPALAFADDATHWSL